MPDIFCREGNIRFFKALVTQANKHVVSLWPGIDIYDWSFVRKVVLLFQDHVAVKIDSKLQIEFCVGYKKNFFLFRLP